MSKDIQETINIFQNIKSEIKKTNIAENKMLKTSGNKAINQKIGNRPLTEKKKNIPYDNNQINSNNSKLAQKNERIKEKSYCKNEMLSDKNSSKFSKKIVDMYKQSFVSPPYKCKR